MEGDRDSEKMKMAREMEIEMSREMEMAREMENGENGDREIKGKIKEGYSFTNILTQQCTLRQ